MLITVAELRRASELLMNHLEAQGRASVQIDHDYYWFVPTDQRYDQYKEPKQLTLGQLSDDWSEIRKILDGKGEPVNYALVWLSSLLRAVGETCCE